MEEEQQENWCQNPHYAKIGKNWHWCQFWPCRKIGIGANFGTMPIFGINFVRAGKLALVPILALCQFLALILALEQKLALVPILALCQFLALILALEQKLALVPILALVWCKFGMQENWHWCQFWHQLHARSPLSYFLIFFFFFPLLPSLFNAF